MNHGKKFCKHSGQLIAGIFALVFSLQFTVIRLNAQNKKTASIKLFFLEKDSIRICKAFVTSDNLPVKGKEVHFYVKRSFFPLPIEDAIKTDENGEAVANFPMDLPGDKYGNIVAIVKIEDDDTYGTVETQQEIKWGVPLTSVKDSWSNRSLSASREKAPMYLIVVSNSIIVVIWGTICYVILQLFRIKKESNLLKKGY